MNYTKPTEHWSFWIGCSKLSVKVCWCRVFVNILNYFNPLDLLLHGIQTLQNMKYTSYKLVMYLSAGLKKTNMKIQMYISIRHCADDHFQWKRTWVHKIFLFVFSSLFSSRFTFSSSYCVLTAFHSFGFVHVFLSNFTAST